MSGTYAAVQTTIWRDEDWRNLTRDAQHLYLLLLSQPTRSACGLLPVQVRKWSVMSAGTTVEDIQGALSELATARYVLVDDSTDEVVIRSFIRHDGGYRNEFKNRVAVFKAIEGVESGVLRRWLTAELQRLIRETKGQVKADGIGDQIGDQIGDGIPTTITTTSTTTSHQSPLPKSPYTTLSSQGPEPVGIILDQPTETGDDDDDEPFWIETTEPTEPPAMAESEYPPDMPDHEHQTRINQICALYAEYSAKNNPGKIANPKALKAAKQAEARSNPDVTLWARQFPTATPEEIATWIHDNRTPHGHHRQLNQADRAEQAEARTIREHKAKTHATHQAEQDTEHDNTRTKLAANGYNWRQDCPTPRAQADLAAIRTKATQ